MPLRRPRGLLWNTALAVATTLTAAGAFYLADVVFGLGLRARIDRLFVTSSQEAEPIFYIYDARCGWKMNPHTQIHRQRSSGPFGTQATLDARLRTNADGFLDREHPTSSSYYRVAFVGDSWVEAQQYDASLRFSNLTEDYVFRNSNGKKAVEVMNFGVSNHGTVHSYGVIRHWVVRYHPDEVWIFFFSGNDLGDNSPIHTPPPLGPTFLTNEQGKVVEITFGFPEPPAVTHERLRKQRYGALLGCYRDFMTEVMPYFYAPDSNAMRPDAMSTANCGKAVMADALENTRMSLGLISRLCSNGGVKRTRLVYIPSAIEIEDVLWSRYEADVRRALGESTPKLSRATAEARLRAIATESGMDFVSLVELITKKGREEMYADHFSQLGHHHVAEFLAQQIIASVPDREWPRAAHP
jgi:hypothetical protein